MQAATKSRCFFGTQRRDTQRLPPPDSEESRLYGREPNSDAPSRAPDGITYATPSLASGEPEGAALGVPADRPPLARVDDLAAQLLDAGERLRDVGDGEVGKREAVAGPGPALVQPERNSAFPRLPAASLPLLALGERDAPQPLPEPASALRVVCGKLDERQLDHAAMVPLYRHCGGKARRSPWSPSMIRSRPGATRVPRRRRRYD
jgi:hypothetical protein